MSETNLSTSGTLCGKCFHPMHWHECPLCTGICRNDVEYLASAPTIRCASCKVELRYDPTDPVAHIGCLMRDDEAEAERLDAAPSPPADVDGLVARLRKVFLDWAIQEPVNQALHGWRCTYPDRYPEPCGHFDEFMGDVEAALLAGDKAEAPE